MTTPEEGPCSHPGCQHHVTHPCECCGRQWGQSALTTPEKSPLWAVHTPGGGVKKVRLPPLPDKISWVVKFKDGRARRFSYPVKSDEDE